MRNSYGHEFADTPEMADNGHFSLRSLGLPSDLRANLYKEKQPVGQYKATGKQENDGGLRIGSNMHPAAAISFSSSLGLPLDQKLENADSEPWCGIQIIDLSTGACVGWLRIDGNLAEIYDLEVLPGVRSPMAVSPGSHEAASTITIAGDSNPPSC